MPNAASPRTVPGASSATEVVSRDTGILLICSAVRIVVDSTDDTSIGLMAPVPTTVTVSRVVASPLAKSTVAALPTLTVTLRGAAPLRLIWYWPVGSCEKR